ncbi:FecR domain-containing protein [Herminiimonas arsenitoxidans]|uniref:FecR domain-containing protein n=1 Tax=Herminiimonas arsenitoxidans TaxID=1809410 RepID=UPI0009F9B98F|nr:FecR family protein [Herminiimonas arsenitoxidans]
MRHPSSNMCVDGNSLLISQQTISQAALDAAIDWMVLFRSGESSEDEYQRFAHWKSLDSQHEHAWNKVAGVLDRSFAPIRSVGQRVPGHGKAAELAILQVADPRHSASRRKLLGGLLAFGAISAVGVVAVKNGSVSTLVADLRTGTGERKTFNLPDGSTVMLNACSAADVDFDGVARVVRLRKGELVASVKTDARPFIVQTDCGMVRALGTRFLVRQEADRSFALVLEHTVGITTRNDTGNGNSHVLREGEAVWFDRDGIGAVQAGLEGKAAWMDGMLSVNDESLEDVIAALRPYRTGFVRVSPAAAQLRVLGAFPLDNTNQVLESLVQTLPIRITRYSDLFVLIDVA